MKIFYTKRAVRDLESLSRQAQKRIVKKMRFYIKQKDPLQFAKPLVNRREGKFRFRVGKYRIIFDVRGNKIFILKIDKRDKVYK